MSAVAEPHIEHCIVRRETATEEKHVGDEPETARREFLARSAPPSIIRSAGGTNSSMANSELMPPP
jgi:hypothetical protein